MDWLDLLAVQGTLKSLLQHHSSKPSILRCSAFFIVQLSYPYVTTGKTMALTKWTFIDKVMSAPKPPWEIWTPRNLYWEDEGQRSVFSSLFRLTWSSYTLPSWGHRALVLSHQGTQGDFCCYFGRICSEEWLVSLHHHHLDAKQLQFGREKFNNPDWKSQGQISTKEYFVTRGPSRSKNQVTFGSSFDPGIDRVRAWVTLSGEMELFGMVIHIFFVLLAQYDWCRCHRPS